MRTILSFAMLVGATSALAADTALPNLAGRYYRQFPNALVSGEKYTGENTVEIVPVAPGAAYVRIHLDYYNGHSCGIYGVAQSEGDTLVYRDPGPPSARTEGRRCELRVRRSGKSLSIDDGEGSCLDYCGMRGTLSRVALPYGSKRPITYLGRLKSSSQYRAAVATWRGGGAK